MAVGRLGLLVALLVVEVPKLELAITQLHLEAVQIVPVQLLKLVTRKHVLLIMVAQPILAIPLLAGTI